MIDTFIFPGAGGVDGLVEALQETLGNETSMIVDWQEQRGSILTAAYDGEAVGEAISEAILACINNNNNNNNNNYHNKIKRLHFIGISVGGFAANAAATTLYRRQQQEQQQQQQQDKEAAATTTTATAVTTADCEIQLTLLDPFCGRGVFQPNYGKEHFGKFATTAIHILNTDDPVPTTNDPLPNCYCLDVTNAPEREEFVPPPGDSMHSWPLAYFIWKDGNVRDTNNGYPRGVVVKVDEWTTEAMPPLPWEIAIDYDYLPVATR
ncbi:hypothetical protein IV203_029517 [Nitzschia inconspicua]|uniref:Uncharacterized protein n=1 Tax=Nitzschia inconspicua TaxID=303405 RepID=A0A9K3LR90_9STRA|nr:hypothetical protein IV203_029517 [Nitzschia inconspicua]